MAAATTLNPAQSKQKRLPREAMRPQAKLTLGPYNTNALVLVTAFGSSRYSGPTTNAGILTDSEGAGNCRCQRAIEKCTREVLGLRANDDRAAMSCAFEQGGATYGIETQSSAAELAGNSHGDHPRDRALGRWLREATHLDS
jgi:hypothetical protein